MEMMERWLLPLVALADGFVACDVVAEEEVGPHPESSLLLLFLNNFRPSKKPQTFSKEWTTAFVLVVEYNKKQECIPSASQGWKSFAFRRWGQFVNGGMGKIRPPGEIRRGRCNYRKFGGESLTSHSPFSLILK